MAQRIYNPLHIAFVALAWVACAFGLMGLSVHLTPREGQIDDFVQEWTSARNHLHGRPIYEDLHISVTREIGPEVASVLPNQYNGHPPTAVLLALPLGSLPYQTALFVWNLTSLAALFAALWLMLGRVGLNLPISAWAFVGAVLLWSTPLARQIIAGQLNLFLLLLITGGWAAMRHRRDGCAGMLLGTAAALKLFPAFLFLYPLVLRRWRAIAAGGAVFLALNAIAAAILGVEVFHDFITLVLPDLRKSQDWWLNFSAMGYFRKLFYVTSGHSLPLWQNPMLYYFLIGSTTLGVTIAAGWKVRNSAAQAAKGALTAEHLPSQVDRRAPHMMLDVAFAVCLIANLLVSPITWDHYCLLLSLPILILWNAAATVGQRVFLLVCVLLLSINVLWIWGPLISGEHELAYLWGGEPSIATPLQAIMLLSYPFYTLAALFVFGLTLSERQVVENSS
jgi:hypothetical protein